MRSTWCRPTSRDALGSVEPGLPPYQTRCRSRRPFLRKYKPFNRSPPSKEARVPRTAHNFVKLWVGTLDVLLHKTPTRDACAPSLECVSHANYTPPFYDGRGCHHQRVLLDRGFPTVH